MREICRCHRIPEVSPYSRYSRIPEEANIDRKSLKGPDSRKKTAF
jgi:hypothetical protein